MQTFLKQGTLTAKDRGLFVEKKTRPVLRTERQKKRLGEKKKKCELYSKKISEDTIY